ncbi:MAG: transketolase [Rhodothermales bacterium]|nr:transketolase [Rhodothermales bacterium]
MNLDALTVNTIRFLAVDAVQQANSGHPGMPMGCAAMAHVLWSRHLKHSPQQPDWPDRDRFVLSAGHGSMLLYALLHLTGYDLPLDEIKNFRQWDSMTPGHPEAGHTPGVETTTGPLGQGFANGIGMAIAERHLAARFNRPGFEIFNHHTYAIVSDGDLMEGVSHEAASLAGHLGLGKLVYLYDDNGISIDGSTSLAFSENVPERFAAYGWHVQSVDDGNDLEAIDEAIQRARDETDRPSIICVKTVIGYGSPAKQNTAASHGSPLGDEEVKRTKENLGWPPDKTFYIPDDVLTRTRSAVDGGRELVRGWDRLFNSYLREFPEDGDQLRRFLAGELPEDWDSAFPSFEAGDKLATRSASGKTLEAVQPVLGNLIGGSADLTPSNNTRVSTHSDFSKATPAGGYLRFGVREHAMAAISNGLALHGGIRPYCATFLVFSDYLRPSLRLSALMQLPVVYVFTHDSIGLGEDGPTHQAVEHFAALRAIPGLTVIRPADANETVEAWRVALQRRGPVALLLTRQKLPVITGNAVGRGLALEKGAYILHETSSTPDLIMMGTGSEMHLLLDAAATLEEEGRSVRVVSMPSWELFAEQSTDYRDSVLPPSVTARLSVEAGVTLGWDRYVGRGGRVIGLDRFGASAPGEVAMHKLGFSVDNVLAAARSVLKG